MTRAALAALACAAGCAGGGWARPSNIVDARASLQQPHPGGSATQTGTVVYRRVLAPTWGAHCRMLPTDSVYFDRQVARCGAVPGTVAGVSRLLREVEASPETLVPVPAGDRVHWLDPPRSDGCWR